MIFRCIPSSVSPLSCRAGPPVFQLLQLTAKHPPGIAALPGGSSYYFPNGFPVRNESLKKCLEEEAGEVLQAVEQKDDENLCEELGDLLLQVLLHCEIARERGAFSFQDVIQVLADKLIRRRSPRDCAGSW